MLIYHNFSIERKLLFNANIYLTMFNCFLKVKLLLFATKSLYIVGFNLLLCLNMFFKILAKINSNLELSYFD